MGRGGGAFSAPFIDPRGIKQEQQRRSLLCPVAESDERRMRRRRLPLSKNFGISLPPSALRSVASRCIPLERAICLLIGGANSGAGSGSRCHGVCDKREHAGRRRPGEIVHHYRAADAGAGCAGSCQSGGQQQVTIDEHVANRAEGRVHDGGIQRDPMALCSRCPAFLLPDGQRVGVPVAGKPRPALGTARAK